MKRRDSLRCVFALLGLMFVQASYSQSMEGATVAVRQLARNDGAVHYLYRLDNRSSQPVVALILGHDYAHGTSELTAYPLGWQAGGLTTGLTSPRGWRSDIVATDESRYVEIEWRSEGAADVGAGQGLDGFGAVLAAPNAIYTSATWTAIFGDGTTASGKLLIDSAPRLSGSLDGAVQTSPGQWQVRLVLTNQGGAADRVQLDRLALRTLAGTGSATVDSPLVPLDLGAFGPGEVRTVLLRLAVPVTVRRLAVTQGGTVQIGGRKAAFSASQQFLVK